MSRPVRLVVTTSRKPTPDQLQRAADLAVRFGGALRVRDGSVERLVREEGADGAYLVTRTHDEVRVGDAVHRVHPGMIYLKQKAGLEHPLLRAVAPADATPVTSLVDCTLGVAGDAIHLARMLPDLHIDGCEASPVLHALLEEGLPRLARDTTRPWGSAAARIRLHGEAEAFLATQPDASRDVVFLDPMFRRARGAAGGFGAVRRLATEGAPSVTLLEHARRVARRRVVLKIHGALPVPSWAPPAPGWNRRVRGGAVDYLACELELPDPEWHLPDL